MCAKERARILGSKLVAILISFAWLIYAGTTGYVPWRILAGDVPSFLRNYTSGTNAAWIIVGIVLWLLTEWLSSLVWLYLKPPIPERICPISARRRRAR